ncbi:MAG: hypothetical protein HKM94_01435 [Halobacteria archaeon]|nr:hypothetical protein [Halobacteria archaeon]
MTSSNSTALVGSEDYKQVDERCPSIVRGLRDSANARVTPSDTSGILAQDLDVRPPVIHDSPDPERQRERFEVLDSWEGVVTEVERNCFFASMRRTNSKIERAEAEFEIDIDNVAKGDRELVQNGSVFYLTVGISYPRGQGPQKTTRLIFRRMPRWSSRDIARAEAAATELWEKLNPGAVTPAVEPQPETR